MPRSKGRTGRPWRQLRQRVITEEDICALCGGGVDKTLRWPHPYSPSVDHTQPLGQGGAPVSRANARLAHLRCNIAKRDGRKVRPKTRQRTSREW